MKEDVVPYFKSLQDNICKGLEQLDGEAKFKEDLWQREGGGGGRTRIIENGKVFEKGGVNFSEVFGIAPEILSKEKQNFFATGVSIVIHPNSPMVPIIHMNIRYFQLGTSEWFGGGIDLTPIYVNEEDAYYFHQTLKTTCDRFHPSFYPEFKKWADEYFFLSHRNETRGIGGIFFDYVGMKPEQLKIPFGQFFEFVMAVGNVFLPIYSHLVRKNKDRGFTEKEKKWQLIRRGRYVEFNLVYDRGTRFGLESNGRTESILMSLPPKASWLYNFLPEKNSEEEKTLSFLKKGIVWTK